MLKKFKKCGGIGGSAYLEARVRLRGGIREASDEPGKVERFGKGRSA